MMQIYALFANPDMFPGNAMMSLALILALGVAAQWLAWRIRLPSILLLLATGFLAGPVFQLLDPDRLLGPLLRPMVSLFVAFILFEGGLTLNFADIRGSGAVVRNMVTVGAAVTWIVSVISARLFLGFDLALAMLLGAVLIVTGPTVIMPMLRYIRPTGPVGPILRWEGIIIDPIGATLAVVIFEVIAATERSSVFGHMALAVGMTLGVGVGLGILAGFGIALAIKRFWLPDFLQNAAALALVALVYAVSNRIQEESGLLTVTVMGIVLANQRMTSVDHILDFKENLRVLFIAVLFIVLTARLELADLSGLRIGGIAFVAALVLVARPLAVLASTAGSGLDWKSRIFLMCVAPRGIVAAAVASVFGIELARTGYEDAIQLTAATFLTIAATVLIYGLAARPIANRLGVAVPNPQGLLIVGAGAFARAVADAVQSAGFRVLLVDTNHENVAAARMAGLTVMYGSIVGERSMERLTLGGLGRLLALTPNDEVNVLAAQRFARVFGKESVYQLPPRKDIRGKGGIDKQLQGRWLFAEHAELLCLEERVRRGSKVKVTKLSAEFDMDAFRRQYGDSALILFRIDPKGRLLVRTAGDAGRAVAGDAVIALTDVHAPEHATEPNELNAFTGGR